MNRRLPPLVLLVVLLSRPAQAQDAAEVYERFSPDVLKVELLEAASEAPSVVGTAFYVQDGLLLTNYHVVRGLVFQPDRYTVRLVANDASVSGEVELVAVDPPNDLAVLRAAEPRPTGLHLSSEPVPNGEVLYSLGHPADLRTAVVEGVFNGSVEHALSPLLHFSGSINPGMSGGPTVRRDGSVVGINVSTAGNQLSFLIPATEALSLVQEARAVDRATVAHLRAQAGRKLTEFQDGVYRALLEGPLPTTRIREAVVPSGADRGFDCSAEPHEVEDDRYAVVEYRCHTQDDMLLGADGSYDLLYMEHIYLDGGELNTLAFNGLFSEWYRMVLEWEVPENRLTTDFRCRRENVELERPGEILVAVCMRQHLGHEGLYDLFVRSALLGGGGKGVVSTLRASPTSFENALAVTEAWLERFAWDG